MSAKIYEAFRINVRRRMSELDINQRQLSRRLGVTDGFVSQILLGRENPGLTTVSKFADALECGPDELVRLPVAEKIA